MKNIMESFWSAITAYITSNNNLLYIGGFDCLLIPTRLALLITKMLYKCSFHLEGILFTIISHFLSRTVGIDLGTSNSAVSIIEGGLPIIIPTQDGDSTTPSVVAFTEDGSLLVGTYAKRQAVLNPSNTFYSIKRFLGRRPSEIIENIIAFPFKVSLENSKIGFVCPTLGRNLAAEEISAKILRALVDNASEYMQETISKAIITVPAYFDDSQRQATKDAGLIAGLEVIRILNEPTAGALCFGLQKEPDQIFMVFDLGGGTFDLSIIDVGDEVFEVLSTCGDTLLGGDNFNSILVRKLLVDFLVENDKNIQRDFQALQRIIQASEAAKIELSSLESTQISLPFISRDYNDENEITKAYHIEKTLTRSEYEELCQPLLDKIRMPMAQALIDADLSIGNIKQTLLIGGSTRMPCISKLISEFTNAPVNSSLNPDEAVALGAAIQAGILEGTMSNVVLIDVTPLSLGVEINGGLCDQIIPRNSTVPTTKKKVYTTSEPNQPSVQINVLQGERSRARDNKSIGSFGLRDIPRLPKGTAKITVSFDLDKDGILTVTASEATTGKEQTVVIENSATLSSDEISRIVKESEENRQADQDYKDFSTTKTDAQDLISRATEKLDQITDIYTKETVTSSITRLQDALRTSTTAKELRIILTAETPTLYAASTGNFSASFEDDVKSSVIDV